MLTNTDWLVEARWGVFTHYLSSPTTSADEWNRRVDGFDVQALAQQLERARARYHFITIGQNSGHYCAPSSTYDALVDIHPSKCSRRDLVIDLYEALAPRGIALLVYLPSGAPSEDDVAVRELAWQWGFRQPWPGGWGGERTGLRLAEFQVAWEAVVKEWSLRWGNRVRAWWFDGCYFADEMYRAPEPPNFQSFAAAARAGNAQSLVAFNPGVIVPVTTLTPFEDYTAGEISAAFPVCPGREVDGAQYHVLSYLGERWGGGAPRFPDEFVIGYTKHVNSKEGVVTWDVPITTGGTIPQPFVDQLETLGRHLAEGATR